MIGGLEVSLQDDWSAGMFRGVARHLIDGRGAYTIQNALSYSDDGSLTRRGGSAYKSTPAFGASLRWIWDGILPAGARTVFASPSAFGVLDSDDTTPVSLGGSGLSAPVRAVGEGGLLIIGGGVVYGGSRKAAAYSTGTVSVTNGSTAVTGTGTSWTANVDAGMLIRVAGAGRYYRVASVTGNTTLVLAEAYEGATLAGQTYAATRLGDLSTILGSTVSTGAVPTTTDFVATAGKRLLLGSGNQLAFSAAGNPFSFAATDYHTLPAGAEITGIQGMRDSALVFTTQGIFQVANMSLNLIDAFGNPQQRLEALNSDLILWGAQGIATWQNSVVVPATDGAWLLDPAGGPTFLSNSIPALWRDYVAAGYRCGGATVFKSHYLLPILDSSNALVDLLACRLDRPVQTRVGTVFAWSQHSGAGANMTALTRRVGSSARQPVLLGALRSSVAKVTDCSGFFAPSATLKNDADGTTHTWRVDTRDYPSGRGLVRGLIKRLRARYELVDAGTDNPTISAYGSVGQAGTGTQAVWGTAVWGTDVWGDATLGEYAQLSGLAPEDDGRSPWVWLPMRRGRFVRFRLQSTSPAASLILRSLELFARPTQRG